MFSKFVDIFQIFPWNFDKLDQILFKIYSMESLYLSIVTFFTKNFFNFSLKFN